MHPSTPHPLPGRGRSRRLTKLLAACAVAGAAAAVAPGIAGAATVGFDQTNDLAYNAAPGEANHLVVDIAPSQFLRFTDPGALITPGAGCIQGAPSHTVECGIATTKITANLGDGDDSLDTPADFRFRFVA